jgi:hypothetical protein
LRCGITGDRLLWRRRVASRVARSQRLPSALPSTSAPARVDDRHAVPARRARERRFPGEALSGQR